MATNCIAQQPLWSPACVEGPYLTPAHPLPDLPHPALTRAHSGHTGSVRAVAVAPDGNWLATAGDDATVRIWDPPWIPAEDPVLSA